MGVGANPRFLLRQEEKALKDLLNLLKNQGQVEEFDAIRIGLASPEMIRS